MAKFIFSKDEPKRVIAWPCKITVPVDGGSAEEKNITAKFRIVAPERAAELVRLASIAGGDASLLKEALAGFVDLEDDAKNAVPDDIAIPLLLSLPYAVAGLTRGYFDMLQGRVAKN